MPSIKDTACSYAWTYPIIDLGRRELRNCCRTPANAINQPIDIDIFKNLEKIKKIKTDLLTGVKNIDCSTCWTSEEAGIQSKRTGFKEFAKLINTIKWNDLTLEETETRLLNLTEGDIQELVELEYAERMEISLSTVCDLKCVYCSPHFSTQWATEKLKYKEIRITDIPKNDSTDYEAIWWEWFTTKAYKSIKFITFVGGEPLINNKFYSYVNKIIDFYETNTDNHHMVEIFVVTNMNTPPKFFNQLIDLMKRVKDSKRITLGIGASFESIGTKTAFIRSNADWALMNGNLEKVLSALPDLKSDRIFLTVLPSFNSLSISDLPNFVNYVIGLRRKYNRYIGISTTHVTFPSHYSPFILTDDYTKYVNQAIDIIKKSKLDNGPWLELINYFETIRESILKQNVDSTYARKRFVEDIDKLCVRRQLDFHKTFPEMIEFYNYCRTL